MTDIPAERPEGPTLSFAYTNWRSETSIKTVVPIRLWFGQTDWHPEDQLLIEAWDVEKDAKRDYAFADIVPLSTYNPETVIFSNDEILFFHDVALAFIAFRDLIAAGKNPILAQVSESQEAGATPDDLWALATRLVNASTSIVKLRNEMT